MRALRAAMRAMALAACTALTVVGLLLSRLLEVIAPQVADRFERWVARRWARSSAWILGLRISLEGQPPAGRYLLVSNHLSYIDIVTLMNVLDARFLSKAEVASWPLIGPVTRLARTLFVDRTRRADLPRVIAEIESVLEGGRSVVFFPEGTSSAGYEVLPFKASLFEAAARGGLEIACATLHYATPDHEPPAELSVCWWGDTSFGAHILPLLGLSRFEAQVRFSETRLAGTDRKQLANDAREEVLRLFRPVCDEDPAAAESGQ